MITSHKTEQCSLFVAIESESRKCGQGSTVLITSQLMLWNTSITGAINRFTPDLQYCDYCFHGNNEVVTIKTYF